MAPPDIRQVKEVPMFDSLADRIREDDQKNSNPTERIVRWVIVSVVSVVVFGGIYWGIHLLQG
jgi:hypothetical protein